MCVDDFIEHAVTDRLARSHNETVSGRYDERYVGFCYPAGLRGWHTNGRTVLFPFAGHRPS